MTISINLRGRLGNQLFQYAALRNLSIKKKYDIFINTNFSWHGQSCLLSYFNIKESSEQINIEHLYYQPVNSYYFDINFHDINDNTLLEGHFENIEYFKENREIIRKELSIKDNKINTFVEDYLGKIAKHGNKIVGIHFRRGDLIQQIENINEFNKDTIKYVIESLEKIKINEKNITLLLFTGGIRIEGSDSSWMEHSNNDDIDWLKQFVTDNENDYNIHISPGTINNEEIVDYVLLSNCDYMISPYISTFSFMAYYMSNKNIELYSKTKLFMK